MNTFKKKHYINKTINIMNIIIPLGGIGKRFLDDGYSIPKPILYARGKYIISWLIENLKFISEDEIYIPYNKILKHYNFESTLRKLYPDLNFNFIELEIQTVGATHTLDITLDHIKDHNRKIVSLDGDTFYEEDILTKIRNTTENAILYFKDYDSNPIYSYIKLEERNENERNENERNENERNENERVLEIQEKIKISDNANSGCYVFKNGIILKKYCKKLMDKFNHILTITDQKKIQEKKELYISSIYKEMIIDKIEIVGIMVKKVVCLGTPNQIKMFLPETTFIENKSKLRFCFDLDNTLVTYPTKFGDYTTVKPIERNIKFLRYLKSLGHTIIIHTARGMATSKGDVKEAIERVGKVTIDTLAKLNIPYDDIIFGKPEANFYIDDKAINAFNNLEKETGFYQVETLARNFNKVEIKNDTIIKKSKDRKLLGEIYWYQNIPKNIEDLFPKMLKYSKNDTYEEYFLILEKIQGLNLSYIYTEGKMDEKIFDCFMCNINRIHLSDSNKNIQRTDIYFNYTQKIKQRYIRCKDLYSYFDKSEEIYNTLIEKLDEYERSDKGTMSIIHGDPVFTNVFYTDKQLFKFIDMRGMLGDKITLWGDRNYDYAKIYQSILGYDFIVNDKEMNMDIIEKSKKYFENKMKNERPPRWEKLKNIKLITASLLFSLIPLHLEEDLNNLEKVKRFYNLIFIHKLLE